MSLPLLLLPQQTAERPCLVFAIVSAEMASNFVVCADSAEMASDFAVYMIHVRHVKAVLPGSRGESKAVPPPGSVQSCARLSWQ